MEIIRKENDKIMYKSYDVTLEFFGFQEDLEKYMHPLVNPKRDIDNVKIKYFLKRLGVKKPKDDIVIYDEHIDYIDELCFTIEINKKEDEEIVIDFINEIYKKAYKKINDIRNMGVNLKIKVSHGNLYRNEGWCL